MNARASKRTHGILPRTRVRPHKGAFLVLLDQFRPGPEECLSQAGGHGEPLRPRVGHSVLFVERRLGLLVVAAGSGGEEVAQQCGSLAAVLNIGVKPTETARNVGR